ncbi:glycoside hydrolase family 32 protein [Paenibacillus doosanensis]|uniref:glycoside hydrolase family 32 protein n=1 Tax=Paenibacillus doosanensis TaxID=1229154 RepID=UPI00217F5EA0|nr:glycoside hydrolase family 32 protein [Paenibacillus doosanensis]MCS7463976.1 glycoside hydrolase family 32 protein [Paenibacillus doosanensis]
MKRELETSLHDPYRPQYHFTPQRQWMNDPNGMVYFEGEYHLFYQYHPYGTTWGPMHWGHAVSPDMVHWEHLPVALEPDEHGAIFSGSAVVDWRDTTGFFGGKPGLVAIFTHHDTVPGSDRPRERQSLAYSTDRGRTWHKYAGNPVLADEKHHDYRDPKVFWHEASGRWVMVLATGQTVSFYTSPDLKAWSLSGTFGEKEGSHDGVWECPDLFELPIEGSGGRETRWVLFVSIGNNPAFPEGSRTQYFTGTFDGRQFVNDNPPETVLWLDYGRDNYAGVSWSDIPQEDGRRIYIGWMSNWQYAQVTPTKEWRSAMTLPRALSLRSVNGRLQLIQRPVEELRRLRGDASVWRDIALGDDAQPWIGQEAACCELIAEFELQDAREAGLRLRTSASDAQEQEVVVGYDAASQQLFVDRTRAGEASFHPLFAGKHAAPLRQDAHHRVTMHIWLDRSSVEVFAGDGSAAITDLIYPADSDALRIGPYAAGGQAKLISLAVYPLAPGL